MSRGRDLPARQRLTVALGLSAAWFLAAAAPGPWGIYVRLGSVALVVIVVTLLIVPDRLRALLRPAPRELVIGLGAGLVMLAATYGGAHAMLTLAPGLDAARQATYSAGAVSNPVVDRTLLLFIIAAEELLWRALLLDALRDRPLRPLPAGALAVGVYALATLGTGGWVVPLLAAVCGTCWTALRLWRDNLWPPLLAHALWTITLLVVAPI